MESRRSRWHFRRRLGRIPSSFSEREQGSSDEAMVLELKLSRQSVIFAPYTMEITGKAGPHGAATIKCGELTL